MSKSTDASHETYLTIQGDRVDFGPDYQGVTLWVGDGTPIITDDRFTEEELRDYIQSPVQRLVARTRLLALADMLDDGPGAALLRQCAPVSIDR